MRVSIEEQEFVINHMRGDQFVDMYVSDTLYIGRLDKLVQTSPEYYKCTKVWKNGDDVVGKEYRFPLKLLGFRKAPVQSNMSEEQKEAGARRMRMIREITDEERLILNRLKELLEDVPKEEYSLYGEKESAVCLLKEEGQWSIFEQDDGDKINEMMCADITQAAKEMLSRIFAENADEYIKCFTYPFEYWLKNVVDEKLEELSTDEKYQMYTNWIEEQKD